MGFREAGMPDMNAPKAEGTSKLPDKLGFPPGAISDRPIRLDILDAKKGVYAAVSKPADILMDSYLGAPKIKSAILAMREQKGKGELERLGMTSPYLVNQIDFEMSGAALLAMNKDVAAAMRNAMWSGFFKFEYLILCRSARGGGEEFEIKLPVLMHESKPLWIVSHRFGKKANTSFCMLGQSRGYQLWKAKASSARPHQIRLHAAEGGLGIVGERLYSKTPYIFLSKLKDEYKLGKGIDEEKPLYPHLCVHLSRIEFDGKDFGMPEIASVKIDCPPPKAFAVCLKKLDMELDSLKKC